MHFPFHHYAIANGGHRHNHPPNLSCLTQPVSPVHGLLVHCRVPVTVVENDSVGRCQIDAETSCPGAEKKDKNVLPLLEVSHHVSPLVYLAAAVQPDVAVLAVGHVLVQQVDHSGHLE